VLVAIDTNILVWAIRKEGPPEKLKRAAWLIHELDDVDAQIIVPTIVVTEYLRPYAHQYHAEQVAVLESRFNIMPFDVKCASWAARLFDRGQPMREKEVEGRRNLLNADSMIIATAYVNGAERIYSDNEDFRDLAGTIQNWSVMELPNIAPDLFQL